MSAIKKSWVFAAVFLGAFVSSADAQQVIIANVPFPFVVNHEKLPAGPYSIRTDDGAVTAIRGMKNNNGAGSLALTMATKGVDPLQDKPALVFARFETGYRLAQIWESKSKGRALPGFSDLRRTARVENLVGSSEDQVYVLAANWK